MPQKPATAASLTDAIAHVESSFGTRMRSPNAQNLGWHQMGRLTWKEVNAVRAKRGLATHKFTDAFDYKISTEYCTTYLSMLAERLAAEFGRKPTTREVLCAYRAGFSGFKRLDFNAAPYNNYLLAVERHLK